MRNWVDNFCIQEMESDVEDEIEKIEVEKVELSKPIDEEALLIWTRILKLNSY